MAVIELIVREPAATGLDSGPSQARGDEGDAAES